MNQWANEAAPSPEETVTKALEALLPGSGSQSASSVTARLGFDGGWLILLSLPWAILRFDRTWLFAYSASSYGFIDPWVYFGYFLDLTQHLKAFKGAYFTTRLSWILPGAFAYHVFPPLVAVYVLHITLFYAATVSLYLILKQTMSGRAAVLGTMLMGCHSYFLRSMGWDYIDGAAMTYMLMTLCALTYAAKSTNPKGILVAVGALAALALYAQLFLVVFSPLALGYYQFARQRFRRESVAGAWKPFAGGFAGVTVILGAFNMAVNGRFFFFANSVGMAAKLVVNHNPYNESIFQWLGHAGWLVLPLVALIGAVLSIGRTVDSAENAAVPLFWQRYLVITVAIMGLWELIGQPVLQLSFYASYLIATSMLALAAQTEVALRGLGRVQFVSLCGCALFLSLLPLGVPVQSKLMSELQRFPLLLPTLVGVAAVVVLSRPVRRAQVPGVLLLCMGLGILTATTATRTWGRAGSPDDPVFQEDAFLSIVDSVRAIQELDPKGNLYFWYDGASRLGRLYRSVASTYGWAYRLQSESFPNPGPKAPGLQKRLLILSEDPKDALAQADASLRNLGLEANLLAQRTIHEGPFVWTMTEVEVISPPDRTTEIKDAPRT